MRRFLPFLLLAACGTQPSPMSTMVDTPLFALEIQAPIDPMEAGWVKVAADEWNAALGVEVFGWGAGRFLVGVTFTDEDRYPTDRPGVTTIGRTTWHGTPGFDADVWFSTLMPYQLEHHTALHELGHVLGAEHSEDPEDVMYRLAHGGVTLRPHDIAAARDALAKRFPNAVPAPASAGASS